MHARADLDLPPYKPARLLTAPLPACVRPLSRTRASHAHPTSFVVIALPNDTESA